MKSTIALKHTPQVLDGQGVDLRDSGFADSHQFAHFAHSEFLLVIEHEHLLLALRQVGDRLLQPLLAFSGETEREWVLVWWSGDVLSKVHFLPISIGFALEASNLQSANLVEPVGQLPQGPAPSLCELRPGNGASQFRLQFLN